MNKKLMIYSLLCGLVGVGGGIATVYFFSNQENPLFQQQQVGSESEINFPSESDSVEEANNFKWELGSKETWALKKKMERKMTSDQYREEFLKYYEFLNKKYPPGMIWRIRHEGYFSHSFDDIKTLEKLLYKWAEISPHLALEELEKKGKRAEYALRDKIFQAWAEKNPEELSGYYMSNRDRLLKTYIVEDLMEKWPAYDSDSAWKWLSSLSFGERREGMTAFLNSILEYKPEKITDYMEKSGLEYFKYSSQFNRFVEKWLSKDRESLTKWTSSLPEEEQNIVKTALVKPFFDEDQESAGQLFSSFDLDAKREAYSNLVMNVDFLGEKEFLQWLMRHATEEEVVDLRSHTILHSGDYTPESTQALIQELPTGKIRDQVIYEYVDRNNSTDYTTTLSLVSGMGEGETQTKSFNKALANWAQKDFQAASDWVEKSSFPEKRKDEWRKTISTNSKNN